MKPHALRLHFIISRLSSDSSWLNAQTACKSPGPDISAAEQRLWRARLPAQAPISTPKGEASDLLEGVGMGRRTMPCRLQLQRKQHITSFPGC